jgi:glycine/D-amino acid oxidase-like deaminating enzyme
MIGTGAGPRVAVVGAGAFGGWTALWLQRRGARVTLLDAWGAGHSRSSSGGETRVIRAAYGADRIYVDWVARSFPLWEELQEQCGQVLLRRTGALWMCAEGSQGEDYLRLSAPLLADAGFPLRELTLKEGRERYPQIDLGGVRSLFLEEEAGALFARRACQAVQQRFVAEGGDYRQLAVDPLSLERIQSEGTGSLSSVGLSDGSDLSADLFVFACGPWLGRLFPEVFGESGIRPSRQEVFFFGLPSGDSRYAEGSCPIWLDFAERIFYGIPGNEHRGFKVADDTRGGPIDPTSDDRAPTPERLREARELLARRFPGLRLAPLVESRVCQYENSPDGHLFFDRHPEAGNVLLVGGGSGHSFKLSPALGEQVARVLLDGASPPELFSVARLRRLPGEFRTQFTVT